MLDLGLLFTTRPRPSDQHAPGHLRPTETARHHPLPGGREPTGDVGEVGERRLSVKSGKGRVRHGAFLVSGRSMYKCKHLRTVIMIFLKKNQT